MEDCILIDWVSITSRIHSPENFISLLGLDDGIQWEHTKGAHGYRQRWYWEKISIHFDGREDMGVWLEMSGQGCRAFETFGTGDYNALFDEVMQEPEDVHLTRLDIAYDDHSGLLDIQRLVEHTQEMEDGQPVHFVSKSRKRIVEWTHQDGDPKPGLSIYHGRKASDVLIRIYDKAAERHAFDEHWVRVELQLRDDRAASFAQLIQAGADIGETYRGVIYNYLRYVEPDQSDSNRWRWPMKDYWANFLAAAGRIRLYKKPGADYNVLRCEDFVFRQAGGAVYTLLELYGIEMFLQKLQEQRGTLNPKYKQLLDQYRARRYNDGEER